MHFPLHPHVFPYFLTLQVYERFDTKTIEDADESRFEYFTKQVSLPFGLLGYLCRL